MAVLGIAVLILYKVVGKMDGEFAKAQGQACISAKHCKPGLACYGDTILSTKTTCIPLVLQ